MSISAIITVYNKIDTIEKCLKSIQDQKYRNFEAVIVDDGSTDKSEKIIEKFLDDKRFKMIRVQNGGVSRARNIGIKSAVNDYIVFIDGDDYIDVDYFQNLYEEENKYPEKTTIMSGFKMNNIDHLPDKKNFKTDELINHYSELSYFLNLPISKLYDAKVIENNNILFNEDLRYGEDLEFNLRYFKFVSEIKFVNTAYYNVIEQKGGLSRSKVPLMLNYQMKIIETAQELYGNDYETSIGAQQIVIKAIKTLFNYDIKNEPIKVFIKHVKILSQLLNTEEYLMEISLNKRSIQDKLIFYLIKKNAWKLLIIIFTVKRKLQ